MPYARNARTHTPAQVAQIAASMKEWGWTNPVLIDEDAQILAGHGRILAADVLGLRDVPVMIAEGWSEAQKRAYVIADNKLGVAIAIDSGVVSVCCASGTAADSIKPALAVMTARMALRMRGWCM